MEKKTASAIMLALLLTSMLALAFNIQPAKASGTICIRADGSIDPPTAPIATADNVTYTLTDNITLFSDCGIIVERGNIIIDGNGYTLQGLDPEYGFGFFLFSVSGVTIRNTNINGVQDGVYVFLSSYNTFSGNNITGNHFGILLNGSSNSTVAGNNITGIKYTGIYLYESSNYTSICGNNIANNGFAIWLSSNYTSISGNNIANNGGGIGLGSSNNSITGNNITANNDIGICLNYHSINNIISGNNVTGNGSGIGLADSYNNEIYHNNFNNTQQVSLYYEEAAPLNSWDDGYPSGGNYWSDYTDVDLNGDGIWDHPYVIDEDNQDRYPLVNPWTPTPPAPDFSITASLGSLTIQQGGLDTSLITITSIGGFSQPVQLGVSGAPSGVTATLNPEQVTALPDGSAISTLTVSVDTTATPGSYTLTVTGNSGALTHSTYISLGITSVPTSEQPQLKAPWVGIARVTQGNNGATSHYDHGSWDNTYAIDVALPVGSDVLTPYDGTVKYVDSDPSGAGGKELALEHTGPTGKKFITVYLHLDDIFVTDGDPVKQGQVVAKSGATGIVTGPHLHFHLWRPKGSEPEWAYDSHTMPIERLVMKQVGGDSDSREYDARKGELDDSKIAGKLFESNNISPISADDIYWLAKAIMSEASVGTQEEQVAVGWTVLNRLDSGGFGSSIEGIVKRGYAYNQEPTESIMALAKDLLERKIPDPTDGATYFFSPRGMPKEGDDTTGFDVGGGLQQVPLDGQDIKVCFPSFAKPQEGTVITETTTQYLTAKPILTKLEWRNLAEIRNWYFMFYRPYTTRIHAEMKSPSELRVYDSQGLVTGLVNGTVVVEIPGSHYFENTVTIFFPNDTYRYVIAGTTEGLYGLTVTAVTRQENIAFSAIDTPTSAEATHQYSIDWAVLSQGGDGVTVQVDSNGDGAFEYTFTSDGELTQTEFLSQIAPPLSVSVSPLSASILVGQSVTFTSTVSGGYTSYSYQWYLNGAPVSGATSASWTFTPTTSGIYYVYLKVTDAKANTAQSDTARITTATVPVGGYSIPIQVQTKAEPIIPYIALIATLTAIFTKLRPKTKRKH